MHQASRRKHNALPEILFHWAIVSIQFNVIATQSLANSFYTEATTNAGFVTRINQNGLDLFADYMKERVIRFMRYGEILFNFTAPLTDEVVFGLISSKSVSFDSETFKSNLSLVPGQGITWKGTHLKVVLGTYFKVITSANEFYGSATLYVNGAELETFFVTGVNADGHLRTDLQKCSLMPGVVIMNFTDTDTPNLALYQPHIKRFVTDRIEFLLCSSFNAELVPAVSNRLMNTPMSAALFDQYFMNYGLIERVIYLSDSIMLKHRGNAFGIVRQGRNRLNDFRLPFRAPPLSVDDTAYGMVDFYFSNYTSSSLLYWIDQYRKFDYEISKDSINSSALVGYLRTECGPEDVCAGTLFPALSVRYPKGIVQIKSHTVTYPRVKIEEGRAVITIWSRVDAFVQQVERTRRFLTAGMMAELVVKKAIFSNYTLTAEMKMEKFKIFDVVSLIDGIDSTSLEFLVSALNELLIGDDVARKLQNGIKLPIIFDFEQKTSEVIFEQDRIRVSIDFCYEQNCNAVAESNDSDYYDSISGTS